MILEEVEEDITFLSMSTVPALLMLVPWHLTSFGVTLYLFVAASFGAVQQLWPGFLPGWLQWPIYVDFHAILVLPSTMFLRIIAYGFTSLGGLFIALVITYNLTCWEPWPRVHTLAGTERATFLKAGFCVALTQLFMSITLSVWLLCPDGSAFGIPIPAYSAVVIAFAMLYSAVGRRAEERAAAASGTEPEPIIQGDANAALESRLPPATWKGDLMRFHSVAVALALHWANRPTSSIFLAATKPWQQVILKVLTTFSAYYAAFEASPNFLGGLVADVQTLEGKLEAALQKAVEEGWRDEDDLEDQVGGGMTQPLPSETKDPLVEKEDQPGALSTETDMLVSATERLVDDT